MHNSDFVLRDWNSWLAPHGPKEMMYYTEPLDFLITVESGQAVLKYRSLCGGNLPWQGPITILTRIPQGSPKVIQREEIEISKREAFIGGVSEYLSDVEIVGWREYFEKMKASPPDEPFCLMKKSSKPVRRKVKIPESIVPEEMLGLYKTWRDKPWQM